MGESKGRTSLLELTRIANDRDFWERAFLAALNGLLANPQMDSTASVKRIAENAEMSADAALAVRNARFRKKEEGEE